MKLRKEMIDIEKKQMKLTTFCDAFDVSRSTVELWIHSLGFPAYKISGHWYVDIPEYYEWREKEHKHSYKYA